jgi:hypothetical protein
MGLARLAMRQAVASRVMSAMQSREIQLKPEQAAYLDEAVKAFNLQDTGKALRILINYARENPDKSAEIFSEIHCTGDC